MSTASNFASKEFVNQNILNAAMQNANASIGAAAYGLSTIGILWPNEIAYSPSGTVLTITFTFPAAIIFNNGIVASAHGATNGQDTQVYAVDCSALTPGSGSVEVYWYATYLQIGQSPITIPGPPQGHPSWNPNFVPYTAYSTTVDSFSVNVGTSVPSGSVELARGSLNSSGVLSGVTEAHAPLSAAQSGLAGGTYQSPAVTYDANGRITGFAVNFAGSTGTANALVVALPSNPTSLSQIDGVPIYVFANATNTTGAVTLNVNGLGAVAVYCSELGNEIWAGIITAGYTYCFVYDGSKFTLMRPGVPAVQQGTGVGQLSNIVKIGWSSAGKIKATVDTTDEGNIAMEPWTTSNFVQNGTPAYSLALTYSGGLVNAEVNGNGQSYLVQNGNPAASIQMSYDNAGHVNVGVANNGYSYLVRNASPNHTLDIVYDGAGNWYGYTDGNTAVPGILASQAWALAAFNRICTASLGGNGYVVIPLNSSGTPDLIIQWGTASTGNDVTVSFPRAFPNACLAVTLSESAANPGTWGSGAPSLHGTANATATGFNHWTVTWNGSAWVGGAATCSYIAIGY